jgi:hypothetical protein
MWTIGHLNYPSIYIGNRICSDGYLNFLTMDNLSEPIMRGKDMLGRKFLTVKYIIDNYVFLDIYLQKSKLIDSDWITCGTNTLMPYGESLNPEQFVFIESIMKRRPTTLTYEHNPKSPYYLNKKFRLFT